MSKILPVHLVEQYEEIQKLYKKLLSVAEQAKDSEDKTLKQVEKITRARLLELAEQARKVIDGMVDLEVSPHSTYSLENFSIASGGVRRSYGNKGIDILDSRAVVRERKGKLAFFDVFLAKYLSTTMVVVKNDQDWRVRIFGPDLDAAKSAFRNLESSIDSSGELSSSWGKDLNKAVFAPEYPPAGIDRS